MMITDQLKKIIEELHDINNNNSCLYYQKGYNEGVHVRVHLVATICDFPERYSRCGITRGNGNGRSRWGYICDSSSLRKYLAPCVLCFDKLKSQVVENSKVLFCNVCNDCTAWSMDNQVLLSSDIKEKPVDFNNTSNKQTPARAMDFNDFKKAVKF